MRRLAVLGSTGSIGQSTLDVVESRPEEFSIVALAAGRNLDRLRRQIERHRPSLVSVADDGDAVRLEREYPEIEVLRGADGLDAVAALDEADLVVAAVVGSVGLRSTMAAIRAGNDVALANKEALVAAGELVMAAVAREGVSLRPIDSEHCALQQMLSTDPARPVDRLILTASGGPFRTWPVERIEHASISEALAHPTWTMGRKISVDSATMVNKGLEIIEATHLFDMPEHRIEVVVHPQSLVHALVQYRDGSMVAHLAANDMRQAILAALSWPSPAAAAFSPLDLVGVGRLDFEAADPTRFPALTLARSALRTGGEMPAVLNAANEVAVAAFLAGRCPFGRIVATIETVVDHWAGRNRSLESVEQALVADAQARRIANRQLGNS
jgi:1-deoxy-D-xylulose-5-phosphate reductoisomerase